MSGWKPAAVVAASLLLASCGAEPTASAAGEPRLASSARALTVGGETLPQWPDRVGGTVHVYAVASGGAKTLLGSVELRVDGSGAAGFTIPAGSHGRLETEVETGCVFENYDVLAGTSVIASTYSEVLPDVDAYPTATRFNAYVLCESPY